jgi:hypothetical protein
MNQFHYYRHGLLLALSAAHTAVGLQISRIRVEKHDPFTQEVAVRLSWL